MSIADVKQPHAYDLSRMKVQSFNRPEGSGSKEPRVYAGTVEFNGQKVVVTKQDTLKTIIDKINKKANNSGIKAVIDNIGNKQKIRLESKQNEIRIVDKDGVLADIVAKDELGTSKSHFIRAVSGRSRNIEINILYEGRANSSHFSRKLLLSPRNLKAILRQHNEEDNSIYYAAAVARRSPKGNAPVVPVNPPASPPVMPVSPSLSSPVVSPKISPAILPQSSIASPAVSPVSPAALSPSSPPSSPSSLLPLPPPALPMMSSPVALSSSSSSQPVPATVKSSGKMSAEDFGMDCLVDLVKAIRSVKSVQFEIGNSQKNNASMKQKIIDEITSLKASYSSNAELGIVCDTVLDKISANVQGIQGLKFFADYKGTGDTLKNNVANSLGAVVKTELAKVVDGDPLEAAKVEIKKRDAMAASSPMSSSSSSSQAMQDDPVKHVEKISIEAFGVDRLVEIASIVESVLSVQKHVSNFTNSGHHQRAKEHITSQVKCLQKGDEACNRVYNAITSAFDPQSGPLKFSQFHDTEDLTKQIRDGVMKVVAATLGAEVIDYQDELSKVVTGVVMFGMARNLQLRSKPTCENSVGTITRGIKKYIDGEFTSLDYLNNLPKVDKDSEIAQKVLKVLSPEYLQKPEVQNELYKDGLDANKNISSLDQAIKLKTRVINMAISAARGA